MCTGWPNNAVRGKERAQAEEERYLFKLTEAITTCDAVVMMEKVWNVVPASFGFE